MPQLDEDLLREQHFFDKEAASLDDNELLIAPDQIERYRQARPSAFNPKKDALFARLGSLEGKQVLDYGCGHGENACLLAACGARVTAFDLSPQSIARARQRAELHGVSDRIQFDVCAAGEIGYPPASFDLVTGFGVLHHLHTMLDEIFAEIARVLKPTGQACFIEPVANSFVLRVLRRLTPVPVYKTPDERQLLYRDFAPLYRHFGKVEMDHFDCLARFSRFAGRSLTRRLHWVDYHTQRFLPVLRRYYGSVVVVATR